MQSIIHSIAADGGINVIRHERVHGGDINEAYCLHSPQGKYFLKLNDANRYPGMFEAEADGLNSLRKNSMLVVPQVLSHGITNGHQWLLLEWIEKGSIHKNSMEDFGVALATMHRHKQAKAGWHCDNYMGSLVQVNTETQHWTVFYAQCRVLPLVKLLFDAKVFSKADLDFADSFCNRASSLFPPEPVALLHGDLWSGNYMIGPNGNVAIFDPAVYYGHREMDFGMARLFGGFSESFYDAYHNVYPLEKNWIQRLPLTQLYPLLVHAVLFGGHYVQNVQDIIRKY